MRKLLVVSVLAFVAMAVPSLASAAPVFHWRVVGRDPVVAGGASTESEMRAALKTPCEVQALRLTGLSSAEIAQIQTAPIHSETMRTGETFPSMAFGCPRTRADSNVEYDGAPVPAWGVSVPVGQSGPKTTQSAKKLIRAIRHADGSRDLTYRQFKTTVWIEAYWKYVFPDGCVNAAKRVLWHRLVKNVTPIVTTSTVPAPSKKPAPKPKPAPAPKPKPVPTPMPTPAPTPAPTVLCIGLNTQMTGATAVTYTALLSPEPVPAATTIQFNWGDNPAGTPPDLSPVGGATQSHDWGKYGSFTVTVYVNGQLQGAGCTTVAQFAPPPPPPPPPPPTPVHACTAVAQPPTSGTSATLTVTPNGPVTGIVWTLYLNGKVYQVWKPVTDLSVAAPYPDDAAGQQISAIAVVSYSDGAVDATCPTTTVQLPCPPSPPPPPPPPPTCASSGMVGDYPNCSCPPGQESNGNGGCQQCPPTVTPPPPPCPQPTPPCNHDQGGQDHGGSDQQGNSGYGNNGYEGGHDGNNNGGNAGYGGYGGGQNE